MWFTFTSVSSLFFPCSSYVSCSLLTTSFIWWLVYFSVNYINMWSIRLFYSYDCIRFCKQKMMPTEARFIQWNLFPSFAAKFGKKRKWFCLFWNLDSKFCMQNLESRFGKKRNWFRLIWNLDSKFCIHILESSSVESSCFQNLLIFFRKKMQKINRNSVVCKQKLSKQILY